MPTKGKKQQRVDAELGPFEPVSEEVVLAAVERAERHWPGEGKRRGATRREIAEHLGFVHGAWTTRKLRPELDALVTAGLLETLRRHGGTLWAPSKAGRRRLASLRRSGKELELPESPQHRAWRTARTSAANRIDEFCTELGRDLDDASALLARHRHVGSDAWLELRDRLSHDCWCVASALHCLYEWPEPDDQNADVDDRRGPHDERLDRAARDRLRWLRSGRRNPNSWTGNPDEVGLASRRKPGAELISAPPELAALGRAVRGLREDRGRTLEELATAANVGPEYLAALEAGQHDPPYDVLLALADGLGVEPATLVDSAEGQGVRPSSGS
jgi:Helix-turn-helix domain